MARKTPPPCARRCGNSGWRADALRLEAGMRGIAEAILAAAFVLLAAAAQAAEGQRLVLPTQERQVHVTYFHAPGDNPRPAALLLHGANGFDSQIDGYNAYASELTAHGIDAYLVYYY